MIWQHIWLKIKGKLYLQYFFHPGWIFFFFQFWASLNSKLNSKTLKNKRKKRIIQVLQQYPVSFTHPLFLYPNPPSNCCPTQKLPHFLFQTNNRYCFLKYLCVCLCTRCPGKNPKATLLLFTELTNQLKLQEEENNRNKAFIMSRFCHYTFKFLGWVISNLMINKIFLFSSAEQDNPDRNPMFWIWTEN